MKRFTFVSALLALIVIGLVAMPAFAQESTPVPDTVVDVVTPDEGSIVLVDSGAETRTTYESILNALLVGAAVLFLGGGGIVAYMIKMLASQNIHWAQVIKQQSTDLANSIPKDKISTVAHKFSDDFTKQAESTVTNPWDDVAAAFVRNGVQVLFPNGAQGFASPDDLRRWAQEGGASTSK